MIKVTVRLPVDYNEETVTEKLSKALKIDKENILCFEPLKLSVDARNKNDVYFSACFAVKTDLNEEKIILRTKGASKWQPYVYHIKKAADCSARPIVVGTGPAGLFAAYILAKAGMCPLVIERGERVEQRVKSVDKFWKYSQLNTESNVQFGEGGAGTFSDGKLNTGISDHRISFVLQTFYEFGAPKEILWRQKPHIGTDKLRKVVANMREKIISLGGEFRFNCRMDQINTEGDRLRSITVTEGGTQREIDCRYLVLAIGHSARDTVENLYNIGLKMEAKPFAIGARIEHSQQFINLAQYGAFSSAPTLPAADYKLAVHLPSGRGVYTFCMCPGGYVVNASSEEGRIAVNGMSNFARNGSNANSALLVNVLPSDFESDHPLAGIKFQRDIEEKAYNISGSFKPPAQTLGTLFGTHTSFSKVTPSTDVFEADLRNVLPSFVIDSIKDGILLMDRKITGFADRSAVLIGPETRSSSPVRILRNENYEADISGVFPCGEGAGYAGGITSAAVDGIKVAERIVDIFSK